MANFTIRAKSHTEWLDARKGGIGASEVGTILGVNPYETPYQLWRRKMGLDAPKQESFLMKAGHYLEDAIARFCADETGVEIIKQSAEEFVVVNRDKQFLRVSPDRYAWLPDAKHTADNKVIIECKSTQKAISEDDIPLSWFSQVMYQLGVCEMPQGYLAWLTQGRDFGYKRIAFDKGFYNDVIVAEIERFWVDNILGKKEPTLTSLDDVKLRYPRHEAGKFIEATPEMIEQYETLKSTSAEIKRLMDIKTEAENALKIAIGEAEGIVAPATLESSARTLVSWKASKDARKFNEKAFAAENADLYESYLETVAGSRRFLVK